MVTKSEREILGFISKQQFEQINKNLRDKKSAVKTVVRLSLQISDPQNNDLDTRIRITNGQVELMQKIGDWQSESREELSITLPNQSLLVSGLWQILSNMLLWPTVMRTAIQTESCIWKTANYELKLTRQFGKKISYSYEIEALNDTVNLQQTCLGLNLPIDDTTKDAAFWIRFNNDTNLNISNLSQEKISRLINKYLKLI